MSRFFSLAAVLSAAAQVAAQTWTSCNPLNETNCPSMPALGTSHVFNWTDSATANTKIWNTTAGSIDWDIEGAKFTIGGKGDSPTLQSNFYIFFGRVSVVMRAATGTGIISSFVLQSDDLDEVDWEWLGGNATVVETNYFGKGNTTSYDRAGWHDLENPQGKFYNYTVDWTKEKIDWYIDDNKIRTLKYEDALDGKNYPQTPMNLRVGVWAGGDPESNSKGTVEWAQGEVNYRDGPYTMTVQQISVEDYSDAKSYSWGDTSGSWESIKMEKGNSTIVEELNKVHGVKNHFKGLPKWAQGTIIASILAFAAVGSLIFCFCCFKRRRAGRKEKLLEDQEWEKREMEMATLKQRQFNEDAPLRGYDDMRS